jgi:hypothetical protein
MTNGFDSLFLGSYVLTPFSSMLNFITSLIVKKEVFEWISTGQRSIDLRGGKAKHG